MFDIFVPFLIGTALGIEAGPPVEVELAVAVEVAPVEQTAVVRPDQMFTTAADVKPILQMTQSKWVAVHAADEQDIIYFTQLASWRCGLESVAFGINGAPPSEPLEMEPCYVNTSAPNALMVTEGFSPSVSFDANSVETVTVAVAYDDGSAKLVTFDRDDVLLR